MHLIWRLAYDLQGKPWSAPALGIFCPAWEVTLRLQPADTKQARAATAAAVGSSAQRPGQLLLPRLTHVLAAADEPAYVADLAPHTVM